VRSLQITSSPDASRWVTRWRPTKPDAPVTRALMAHMIPNLCAGSVGRFAGSIRALTDALASVIVLTSKDVEAQEDAPVGGRPERSDQLRLASRRHRPRQQRRLIIDGRVLVDEHFSGIGHYAMNLLAAFDDLLDDASDL